MCKGKCPHGAVVVDKHGYFSDCPVQTAEAAEAAPSASTNSDYATALRVWRDEWLPLVNKGNHIGNFAWYCEKRLNADEPHCA